jgi:hypothetical protein
MSNKVETRSFKEIRESAAGTWRVRTDKDNARLGVQVVSEGEGQKTQVRVLIPFTTENGNPVPAELRLNGRQARTLYDTLSRFYRLYGEE